MLCTLAGADTACSSSSVVSMQTCLGKTVSLEGADWSQLHQGPVDEKLSAGYGYTEPEPVVDMVEPMVEPLADESDVLTDEEVQSSLDIIVANDAETGVEVEVELIVDTGVD